jgi:GDP-L-fucose synthase
VLPALIRKIHLGKCLEEGNWEAIRADLDKRPIEGVNGDSPEEEIVNVLSRWGVKIRPLRHKGHGETLSVFVEIWGTGKPMREFLWSEDMADACVFIMELVNFEDLKPLSGEVRNTHLNIGTGIEISIRELAFLVKKVTSFRGDIEFDTSKPDGTLRKLTDPSKLHNLGWSHKIEIEEGIDKLYKWYLSH